MLTSGFLTDTYSMFQVAAILDMRQGASVNPLSSRPGRRTIAQLAPLESGSRTSITAPQLLQRGAKAVPCPAAKNRKIRTVDIQFASSVFVHQDPGPPRPRQIRGIRMGPHHGPSAQGPRRASRLCDVLSVDELGAYDTSQPAFKRMCRGYGCFRHCEKTQNGDKDEKLESLNAMKGVNLFSPVVVHSRFNYQAVDICTL